MWSELLNYVTSDNVKQVWEASAAAMIMNRVKKVFVLRSVCRTLTGGTLDAQTMQA